MEYISACEASQKWGVSVRRVQYLCSHGMVPGAMRIGRACAIPADAEKPGDARCKAGRQSTDGMEQPPLSLHGNGDLYAQFFEHFPFPIQIYTPDGTVAYTNEAFLKIFKISGRELMNGKYNILQDPDIGKWGIKNDLARAFTGETIQINDIKVPVRDLVARACGRDLSFESIYQNIYVFPIHKDGVFAYVVAVFITSRFYHGREEIMKSREYIESHWREPFDIDRVAAAVSLSKYHFARLFKEHTGMTPHGYYQDIKLGKLKERLCDANLTVSQAFADCGVDYNGYFAKLFRERAGMTPSQYQIAMTRK